MRIFTNTAISLDGRIATSAYDLVFLGTPLDRAYMSVLRARADAVLMGGRTFRIYPSPAVPNPASIQRLRDAGFPDTEVPSLEGRRWWNVVVTRTLDVPRSGRFFEDPRVRPLFLSSTPGEINGELVVTPQITVPWIVEQLKARGVQNLLIEAGGDLTFQFLEAGVVDDVYVTICPKLVGGQGAPTLADGRGFTPERIQSLSLESVNRVGDELYCHYRVKKGETGERA